MERLKELKVNLEKIYNRNVIINKVNGLIFLTKIESSKFSHIDEDDFEEARVFEDFLRDKRDELHQKKMLLSAENLLKE